MYKIIVKTKVLTSALGSASQEVVRCARSTSGVVCACVTVGGTTCRKIVHKSSTYSLIPLKQFQPKLLIRSVITQIDRTELQTFLVLQWFRQAISNLFIKFQILKSPTYHQCFLYVVFFYSEGKRLLFWCGRLTNGWQWKMYECKFIVHRSISTNILAMFCPRNRPVKPFVLTGAGSAVEVVVVITGCAGARIRTCHAVAGALWNTIQAEQCWVQIHPLWTGTYIIYRIFRLKFRLIVLSFIPPQCEFITIVSVVLIWKLNYQKMNNYAACTKRESEESIACKRQSSQARESIPALKPRADVTRSPKQATNGFTRKPLVFFTIRSNLHSKPEFVLKISKK